MAANLEISTVIGCKMRCNYCPQDAHVAAYPKKGKYQMSLSDFEKYISTVPKHVDIVFAGMAEPFLNEQCLEMIVHAYNEGHTISVYTTGFGIKESDIKTLKFLSFNHFCLHLPDADGVMKMKITPEYLDVLKALMPVQNNLMCIGKLHPAVKEAIGQDVADGSAGLFSRGGNITSLAIAPKQGKLGCSVCSEQLNHNVLLPNGDVLLCCMDYAQKHVLGNLDKVSYADLFTGSEYKKITKGLQQDGSDILCRRCEVSENIPI